MAATKLDAHTVRRIAVACGRDPRTVVSALEGRASALATAAVYDAVERLGILLPADAIRAAARAAG
jgi:hypothetical protein